ncbi:hypothetical protein RRG08_022359 [Elysia crispata]|uniref:Uncharacterized protein n=1 Tax=Elysia crispata TaxID=231223 RepID=A0AAE1D888_9GAST|nr:hypothetical protein RRG08_022359 [Elysia crispata]
MWANEVVSDSVWEMNRWIYTGDERILSVEKSSPITLPQALAWSATVVIFLKFQLIFSVASLWLARYTGPSCCLLSDAMPGVSCLLKTLR